MSDWEPVGPAGEGSYEWVPIESATVHVLDLSGCGLCGHALTENVWHVVGKAERLCSGCHQPVGPQHVICPGCGAHNTLVVDWETHTTGIWGIPKEDDDE